MISMILNFILDTLYGNGSIGDQNTSCQCDFLMKQKVGLTGSWQRILTWNSKNGDPEYFIGWLPGGPINIFPGEYSV